MTMTGWLDTKEVAGFAEALAQDLIGRLPPDAAGANKKHTPERLNNTREALRVRAVAFARTQKLNWYKKAHLANAFKWALREAGYDTQFVDAWTYDLMVAISTKKKSEAS